MTDINPKPIQPVSWQPKVRFSLVSADAAGDRDEDMIAIPRWALGVLAGEATNATCGGGNYEPGCVVCEAIRTAELASECGV
jgi:hypothetical protein